MAAEKEEKEVEEEVPTLSEEPGPITHEPFSLKVFSVAKGQQAANGLRHNDHLRYRQYCTRRLRRLRCTLKWKNGGKGKNKQVPYPNDFADARHLEFPLVCAERAWSYGMQLKSDNAVASSHQPRWRLHSVRRFAKAVKWGEFLEAVCERHGDARTKREAEAYTAFLAGTLLLEKEEWAEALKSLQKCKKVCDHLGLASDAAESALFKTHCQQLEPSIRECKYNLGQAYGSDDDDEVESAKGGKMSSRNRKKESSQTEFEGHTYRGQQLTSPPEKIKTQLFKCLDLASGIKVSEQPEESAGIIDKYGEVSAEFMNALNEIHHDMINATGKDAVLGDKEWRLIEAFTREHNITMNVERNLMLLSILMLKLDGIEDITSSKARTVCRPEEGMRYCDMLKEDLNDLLELPETGDDMSAAIKAYIQVAANCRCFFLALCHSITGKSLESAALLDMLRLRLEDNELEDALSGPLGRLHPLFETVVKRMPNRVAQWRCRGLAALCGRTPKVKEGEAEVGLQDGANFPPIVQNIPCKPLLFDLAFPCIEEPDLEKFLKKSGDKAGLLGRVGSVAGGAASRLTGWFGKK